MICQNCKIDIGLVHPNCKYCHGCSKFIQAEAVKRYLRKYRKTEKGKLARQRYEQSELARQTRKKYAQTPHARALAVIRVKRCIARNPHLQEVRRIQNALYRRKAKEHENQSLKVPQ